MPRIEVTLPDRVDAQLETLVEQQDAFVSRDEAVEELIEMGLRAHRPESSSGYDEAMDSDQMHGLEDSGRGP